MFVVSPRIKDSRTVLDSRSQELDSSLCQQNLDSRIPIVSGIPDSLSCSPDSISKIFPYSGIRISISWVEMVRFLPVEVSRADRSIMWLWKSRENVLVLWLIHILNWVHLKPFEMMESVCERDTICLFCKKNGNYVKCRWISLELSSWGLHSKFRKEKKIVTMS